METFRIDWGAQAIVNLVQNFNFGTVLDIGSGAGEHKRFLEYFGKRVSSVDFDKAADYCGDFMEIDIPEQFDVVWCSHVLEHQRNVGRFLEKIYGLIRDDGYLAIIVPTHPVERLVAGHITNWSVYVLVYNLVLAGFDCSEARILNSVDLSLIVQKRPCPRNPKWRNSVIGDPGEDPMASVKPYFPMPADSGNAIEKHGSFNWDPSPMTLPRPATIINRHFPDDLVFLPEGTQ